MLLVSSDIKRTKGISFLGNPREAFILVFACIYDIFSFKVIRTRMEEFTMFPPVTYDFDKSSSVCRSTQEYIGSKGLLRADIVTSISKRIVKILMVRGLK